MKILVCISRTPDTTTKIAFINNDTALETNGVQWIINPYDEWYALVKAIELKEANPSATIDLIMVDNADGEPILRKAFALGGDKGFRIDLVPQDSDATAFQIAHFAQEKSYDFILTGKETIDFNSGAVGSLVAGYLNLPYLAFASALSLNESNGFNITQDVEDGEQVVACNQPVVVSCQKGMAEQRIPNMRGIMAARTKPLEIIPPTAHPSKTNMLQFELPPIKKGVQYIPAEEAETLITMLNEAGKL